MFFFSMYISRSTALTTEVQQPLSLTNIETDFELHLDINEQSEKQCIQQAVSVLHKMYHFKKLTYIWNTVEPHLMNIPQLLQWTLTIRIMNNSESPDCSSNYFNT